MNPSSGSSGKWAVVVGVLTAALLLATAGDIGMTMDEPAYIAASGSYNGWIHRLIFGPHGVLNQTVVDPAWSVNHEQPPLDKVISGLVWVAARTCFRRPSGPSPGEHFARQPGGGIALPDDGARIGASGRVGRQSPRFLTMPRFFFHAHLAALDVPAACMIVIVIVSCSGGPRKAPGSAIRYCWASSSDWPLARR